ncbi:methylmalonyl Co-A mutase-associated GTPase MeaB [bacterium]|nr:methylmalonyl Co-A mutase-associated GTPase MeaB [bacterium]
MRINTKRRLELSRLISKINRIDPSESFPAIEDSREIGSAFRIGITGPVGAGKSTLINKLAAEIRAIGLSIGILAVDPSSPFTGGAVLGDRIRMSSLISDEGVFIRSLATRGAFGGLAECTVDASDLLDAFGFDRIIIETVGVGQTEVDIVEACDVTIVILEPSSGDSVQAIKAGLMEIADLFVINKMDVKGSSIYISDLEMVLGLKGIDHQIPVIPVQATSGMGIEKLALAIEDFYKSSSESGRLLSRRQKQRTKRIRKVVENVIMKRLWKGVDSEMIKEAASSTLPIREAAREVVNKISVEKGKQ